MKHKIIPIIFVLSLLLLPAIFAEDNITWSKNCDDGDNICNSIEDTFIWSGYFTLALSKFDWYFALGGAIFVVLSIMLTIALLFKMMGKINI